MNGLATARDAAMQMIDTSVVRVHQHGARIAENHEQYMGRSRGGLTSKVHVVVDANGLPVRLSLCLAVWLAHAGSSVTDKILGLLLPISAFVAAGFEHCIANMYFLPLAWLHAELGRLPNGVDASTITLAGIAHNLVPVTRGNIAGGAGLVGLV